VNFRVRDMMLHYALEKMQFQPDLVILDSAGHIGFIEFFIELELRLGFKET